MKAAMLFTGSGPIVILTSYASLEDPALLERLDGKGIGKFIGFEIPMAMAEDRYGGHFQSVLHNLHETDDLRVLDYNGQRAIQLFSFKEIGSPLYHEPAS